MPLKDPVARKAWQSEYSKRRYATDPEYKAGRKATNHGPNRPATEARRDAKRRGLPQRKAKDAVHYKVRKGELPAARDLLCSVCGSPADHYHHHFGYEQQHWYDVIPVCVSCHTKLA